MRKHRLAPAAPPAYISAGLILGLLFLLGGLSGFFFAAGLHGEGGSALRQYLQDYLAAAADVPPKADFFGVVWEQLRFPVLVVLLGFTAAGVVGIPLVFLFRGFLFAFSVTCLFRAFGQTGLVPALLLFGVSALLWVPALFLLGSQGIGASCDMLRRGMGRNVRPAFLLGGYWMRCGLCAGLLSLCVVFEYFVLPALWGVCLSAVPQ